MVAVACAELRLSIWCQLGFWPITNGQPARISLRIHRYRNEL